MQLIPHQDSPRYIRLHPSDNVGVVVNDQGVAAGGQFDDGLKAIEGIPQSHKVALVDIAEGGEVVRYGEVIGYALKPIAAGSWVTEQVLRMPEPPVLDNLPKATIQATPGEPLEGYTFEGFRNPDGSVGTRNILGVTTTVQCVVGVLDHVVERVRKEILPKYPNVDDVVALSHSYGCGVAINAPDAVVPIRTLYNISRNPNLGGQALVISLGCEKLQANQLMDGDQLTNGMDEEDWLFRLQDSGTGFTGMVEQIMGMIEERLKVLDQRRRETVPAAELVVGMQCGGSDGYSGITANPALGYAADLLARNGGTAILSETPEIYGAEHLLIARAISHEVAQKLLDRLSWWEHYTQINGAELNNNPSPGNKAGGLTTILEKSLGAAAKGGTSSLNGVYEWGEPITERGFVFMDSPGYDPVSVTGQVASGANMICFTTGRGSVSGFKPAPCIKLATNTEMYRKLEEDMDINCGGIVDGELSIAEAGQKIFDILIEIASGEPSKSELYNYGDNEFVPWQVGAVT